MGKLHFLVDNAIPEDGDIAWAVRRVFLKRSGGSSGMRSEHLRQWLIVAMWGKLPDSTNWKKVVAIVQAAFCDGKLSDESMRQTAVLIQTGKRDFHRIGMVEVLWNSVEGLLNRRITSDIMFHDVLHSFRANRGTGTATLESKLLQ